MEDEQAYDITDQDEIDKLFAESSDVNDNNNANPIYNDNPLADGCNNDGNKVPDYSTSARPTRTRTKPEQ